MWPFRKSLARLCDEEAALASRIEMQAMALTGQGVDADRLMLALQPLTTELVRVRQQIRARSPWRTLAARRDALREQVAALGDLAGLDRRGLMQRRQLEIELHDLDAWLEAPRRRPMTARSLLLFAAAVATMVFLPGWVARWLAG